MREKNKPPKLLELLLRMISKPEERFSVLGDFEEIFSEIAVEKGILKALLWYGSQIVKSIPIISINYFYWRYTMLRNYFKIAIRNIKKYKGYSFINVAGFTIGLVCCFLILLYIRYEFRYDKYHNDFQYIYRVVREHQNNPTWSNTSEHPLAFSLKQDFPEVVKATRVKKNDEVGVVQYHSKLFNEEGIYFVDQDFLEIFTFPLVSGDKQTALIKPFSILITRDMARKYFNEEDPVGKILRIKEWYSETRQDYTIQGVLENIPKNSHFTFDFLISYNTMYTLKRGGRESVETWSYFEPKTYIKLASETDPANLESKFPAFLTKYKGQNSASQKLHLQSLPSIHLGGNLQFELEMNSDIRAIYLLSAIGCLIMLIACLNYVNLSIARSTKRAVEVGMRKVVGANRAQLVRQFLGETTLFSLLALMISLLAVSLILPVFSSILERNLTLNLIRDLDIVLVFLGLSLFIGIISGGYPAFFVSSFHPIQIIKGTLRIGSKSLAVFRNAIIVVQFVITICLIVCTFVIHNQLSYIKNINLGFDKEQIVSVFAMDRNLKRNSESFKTELLKNPEILGVSASLDLPTTIRRLSTVEWDDQGERRELELNYTFVDYDFFNVYDIGFLKGRNFSDDFSLDKEQAVVVNETAMRILGWGDPIGRSLNCLFNERTVIGVVKDFHFKSLHLKIEPMVFVYQTDWGLDYFSIKRKKLEASWTI
ncbi:MAG: ABC transporter permease, partial [Candidatus Hodarchaeota archaeon]